MYFIHSCFTNMFRPVLPPSSGWYYQKNTKVQRYLSVRGQISCPYKSVGKVILLYFVLNSYDNKIERLKTGSNDSRSSLKSVCSYFLHERDIVLLELLTNIVTLLHYQRMYPLSESCDFVRHSVSLNIYLVLSKSAYRPISLLATNKYSVFFFIVCA